MVQLGLKAATLSVPALPSGQEDSLAPRQKKICISWNSGRCMLPGTCDYNHICATCQEGYRAKDCDATPADSIYKRGRDSVAKRPKHTA